MKAEAKQSCSHHRFEPYSALAPAESPTIVDKLNFYIQLADDHLRHLARDDPRSEVIRLADLSQACLGRFASAPYKDSRAPQNLYPIGGLEHELRHRLGDQRLLYRALSQAAHAG
jgi:hypothetical protein